MAPTSLATFEGEIAELLQLTTILGTQSVTFGTLIPMEEIAKAGKRE